MIYLTFFLYLIFFIYCFNDYKRKFYKYEERIGPCIAWAKSQDYPVPRKPSLSEFFFAEGNFHWLIFPFGLIFFILPSGRNCTYYKEEVAKLWHKWDYWIKTESSTTSYTKKPPKQKSKPSEPELNNAKELIERANQKVSKFDTKGAISDYTKALSIEPERSIIYRFRGLAKKELGDVEGACLDWLLANKLGDTDSALLLEKHSNVLGKIYRTRGLAKKDSGDIDGALKDWEKGKELNDNESIDLLKKYSQEPKDQKSEKGNIYPYGTDKKSFEQLTGKIITGNTDRNVYLAGEITDDIANEIVAKILFLDSENSTLPIYFYINSLGGSVTAGLAIYDTIKYVKSVHTKGVGNIAGMGAMLLAAGKKGKRDSDSFGTITLTSVSGGTSQRQEILFLKDTVNRLLSEMTGQNIKQIEIDTERNLSLKPNEAITYGLLDNVIKLDSDSE